MSDPVLLQGNCLDVLKDLPDNSIDAIVTDPPYGLSFMGKKWDYDVPSVDIWREVLRVLKPGGHLLSFGGTRTYHRMVVNIEDAGFEVRDQIQWLYGSGFPKSHNLEGEWEGWGTALKPANEPICMARKPLEKGLTVAKNVEKWGTGGLNIDGSRIEGSIPQVPQPKFNTTGEIYNMKTGVGRNGEFSRAEGRWPANVILDETAAEVLDGQSGISKSPSGLITQGGKKINGGKFNNPNGNGESRNNKVHGHGDSGGASRFFYVAKASKRERGDGNVHPTVKPVKLMEYLIKLVTPPGGIVLDPFMGSGSTGVAAKNLGFDFVGIEMSQEYLEIAIKRISA